MSDKCELVQLVLFFSNYSRKDKISVIRVVKNIFMKLKIKQLQTLKVL